MDFPPLDWGALFALDSTAFEAPSVDPPTAARDDEGGGISETGRSIEPGTASKLGVCSSCRKKKRKCNLARPSCSLCQINGWICEYRHVKKKPGPPRSSFVRRSRPRQPEELATPPPDSVQSANWESNLTISTFGSEPDPQPVDITLSSASVNVTDYRSPPLEPLSTLSADSQAILTSLYFENVQPIFPLFRRPIFEAQIKAYQVPRALLCMMFALASRYVPTSELSRVFGPDVVEPWDHFARLGFKSSRFCDNNESDAPMSLDDIKTSFLLTLHEYTSFPGRRSWMRVGNTVRVAIAAGLHRIDQPGNSVTTLLSEEEVEERRWTWWQVWRVDSSINILAGSPFNIETCDIHTFLPASSTAEFTSGVIPSSSHDFLPADATIPWQSLQGLQMLLSKDSPDFYYQTVSYNREAAICRRRLSMHPTQALTGQIDSLKQILPYLKIALPQSFFSGVRLPGEEGPEKHRKRIETLILLFITDIILYLPAVGRGFDSANDRQQKTWVADWKMCIDGVEEIADLLRHWEPHYARLTDPMISCVIWISCSILVLHTMSTSYQQSKASGHGDSIQESLEVLTLALRGFARYWPIARLLLKSLENLRTWSWLSLGYQEMFSVASQLHSPVNPQSQNPATIDVWPVFSSPQEDLLDV